MRSATCIAFVALGLLSALAPGAARASFPGADGLIAYSSGGFGAPASGIWAVDPNTGYQVKLTSDADDSFPAFSATGNELAFQRGYHSAAEVYVAQSDGAAPRPVVTGQEPSFSPDGREVAFSGTDGLEVLDLANGRSRRLTRRASDRNPRWSVAGVIAFERVYTYSSHSERATFLDPPGIEVTTEVDVIAQRKGHPRRLVSINEGVDFWPDWSPDGQKLSLASCVPGESELAAGVKAEYRGRRPFTSFPGLRFHPSCSEAVWAPDGNGFAEPGVGLLQGVAKSTCPAGIPGTIAIAWQPLGAQTHKVVTSPCQPGPLQPLSEISPGKEVPGTKLCIYTRRRRHRVCISVS
jgi:hypothetical protein